MTSQKPGSPTLERTEEQLTAEEAAAEQRAKLAFMAEKAPSSLPGIGVLSLLNSAVTFLGFNSWFLSLGLAVTQWADGLIIAAREKGDPELIGFDTMVAVGIYTAALGLLWLLWWLSKRGSTKAYLVGVIFYGLDSFILLTYEDLMPFVFRGFIVALMIEGYIAMGKSAAKAKLQTPSLGNQTPPLTPPAP